MRTPIALAALAAGLLATPVSAQEKSARVKVKMPWLASSGVSGDAVPGFGVRLTDLRTGETVAAVTGPDGGFAFQDLAPGSYRLHVLPPGGDPDRPITIGLPPGIRTARAMPAHTPVWTDISDHDPGVAAGKGHEGWIELTGLHRGDAEGVLLLTIPPAAWRAGEDAAYLDLWIEADAVQGGVVFGDGIRGRRPPPPKKAVTPVLQAEPAERP